VFPDRKESRGRKGRAASELVMRQTVPSQPTGKGTQSHTLRAAANKSGARRRRAARNYQPWAMAVGRVWATARRRAARAGPRA